MKNQVDLNNRIIANLERILELQKQLEAKPGETFEFHHDAGHGWLKIPIGLVFQLKLKISTCSYLDKNFVYLEEDCDAAEFNKVYGKKYETKIIYDGDNSRIRKLARWQPMDPSKPIGKLGVAP